MKRIAALASMCVILILGSFSWSSVQSSSNRAPAVAYEISWYTIDGGGGSSSSADGTYVLNGTIGQPDAGAEMTGAGGYSLTGGFWTGVQRLYHNYLPDVMKNFAP